MYIYIIYTYIHINCLVALDDLAPLMPHADAKPFAIDLFGRSVRFDGARHTSGERRGYITCSSVGPTKHHACFKYRFIKHFGGDYNDTAAWLFAWDACGKAACPTRQAHYANEPKPETVAAIRSRLPPIFCTQAPPLLHVFHLLWTKMKK